MMKLRVTFNTTSQIGVGLTQDVYITPRRLTVEWRVPSHANLLLDALMVDEDLTTKLSDKIFQQNYEITAWAAIENALNGTTPMDDLIQAFVVGRINAVDPTATIYDVENSVQLQP